jgi:hypothetical protein
MTSYSTWDRDAYIDRVGGLEEAERRREALMARVGRPPTGRDTQGAWPDSGRSRRKTSLE